MLPPQAPHQTAAELPTPSGDPSPVGVVLVIDDDAGVRQSISLILKRAWQVETACDVDTGLEVLRTRDPDLVVIDYTMPGKNGLEGIELIRRYRDSIPIIFISGNANAQLTREALDRGARRFFEKPFSLADFSQSVRDLLQEPRN